MSETTTSTAGTTGTQPVNKAAIAALILAVVLPPIGILVAVTLGASRPEQRASGLVIPAIVLGVICTIFYTMGGLTLLAGSTA